MSITSTAIKSSQKRKAASKDVQNSWNRNIEWISNPLTTSDEKVVGLLAIFPDDQNAIALTAITTSGNFNVNWGDGTSTNGTASNTTVMHQYTYSSISQTPTSGGYKQVIVTITPVNAGALQYVDFNKINTTVYTASNIISNWLEIKGSGPNFKRFYAFGGVSQGSTGSVIFAMLENVEVINGNAYDDSQNNMFNAACQNLKRYYFNSRQDMAATANEQWNSTFYQCYSLITFEFNSPNGGKWKPRVVNDPFNSCYNLVNIPYIDMSGLVTVTNYVFYNCTSLQYINPITFSSLTGSVNFCTGLFNLKSDLYVTNNTSQTVSIAGAYSDYIELTYGSTGQIWVSSCQQLSRAKVNVTAANANLSSAFGSCNKLKTVDVQCTGSGTISSLSAFVSNCNSFSKLTGNFVTTASTVFNFGSGTLITRYPAFDYSSTTTLPPINFMTEVFPETSTTYSTNAISFSAPGPLLLREIPAIKCTSFTNNNAAYLTNLTSMLCYGMDSNVLLNGTKLSATALNTVINNLGNGTSARTLTITTSAGAVAAPVLSRTSGTTSGSTTVTCSNTASFLVGTQVTGTGISDARSVTFTDVGDTVTLVGHGIPNGKLVSFTAITSTTGISIYTPYYVVNATTDTFQLSTTAGGSAIALTTNGSGTMIYQTLITAITPNTNVTIDIPASATNASIALSYRNLNTQLAVMKRFTVTG